MEKILRNLSLFNIMLSSESLLFHLKLFISCTHFFLLFSYRKPITQATFTEKNLSFPYRSIISSYNESIYVWIHSWDLQLVNRIKFIYPFTIKTYYPFLWFRDWQILFCKGLESIQFRLYSLHTISVSFLQQFFENSKTQF